MDKTDDMYLVQLGAVVAAMAQYDPQQLKSACATCRSNAVPAALLHEAIVQSYLFLGYPSALEALMIAANTYGDQWLIPSESPSAENLLDTGTETASKVYGSTLDKLVENVDMLSPLLSSQMIREGYGTVLSRNTLPLHKREILICIVLAETGYERQLYSHVRGALRTGAKQHIETTVSLCCSHKAQQRVKTILEKLT